MSRLLAAALVILSSLATILVPASPVQAETNNTCYADSGWKCRTILYADREHVAGAYETWVNYREEVKYEIGTNGLVRRIDATGLSQSCSHNMTNTTAPISITKYDTYIFFTSVASFSLSIGGSGPSGTVTTNLGSTSVQYTTTRQNGPCVSHSYTLTFVPNTPAQIYRMQHWIETRATWSGGKNYTINSYDETRLLLRL